MCTRWTGDSEQAAHYFERVTQLGGNTATILYANALNLLRQGEVEEARNLAAVGVEIGGGSSDWINPLFDAFADPSKRDAALSALDQAAANNDVILQVELTARVILGDTDGVLRIARYLVRPGQAFETEMLFLPEFMPLRERPEFLELMESLGVPDYWQQAGCVWKNLVVECN